MAGLFVSVPALKTLIVDVGFDGRSLGVSLAEVFEQFFVTGYLLKSGVFFGGPLLVLVVCAERAWDVVSFRRLLCILVGGFVAAWLFMLAIAVQASRLDGPAQFGALIMMSMMGLLPMGWGMLAGWLISLLPWFNRRS